MVTFKIQDDQSLKIILDQDARVDVQDILDNNSPIIALQDVLEDYVCNGWGLYYGEQLGQMTDSPFICEDSVLDDDGRVTIFGRAWWYPNYQILCPVEQLLKNGEVVFTLAIETSEMGETYG